MKLVIYFQFQFSFHHLISTRPLLTPPRLFLHPYAGLCSPQFPTAVLHQGQAVPMLPSLLIFSSMSLGTPRWLTESWSFNHRSLIMASQWVSPSHKAFAWYLLPSSMQAGMLIWEQGSFFQSVPGKGGPGWKHTELQSPISANNHCYWLYRKSWWVASCWLLTFLWSWVLTTAPWFISRQQFGYEDNDNFDDDGDLIAFTYHPPGRS